MQTHVVVTARRGRGPLIHASGGIAVRQTGPDRVHLVSTAATPLGGDHIDVRIRVDPGARLLVGSIAATIALPARGEPASTSTWTLEIGAGAELVLEPLPTIVAGDAEHTTTMSVTAAQDARVVVAERVQVGRHEERRGRWSGALHVDVGSTPALRHRLELDRTRRALVSRFVYPDHRPSAVSPRAVAARLDLHCGGSLTTAIADSLAAAQAVVDGLDHVEAGQTPADRLATLGG